MELTSPTNPPATAGAEGGFWRPRRPGRGEGKAARRGAREAEGEGVCCCAAPRRGGVGVEWRRGQRGGAERRLGARAESVAPGPVRCGAVGCRWYGHATDGQYTDPCTNVTAHNHHRRCSLCIFLCYLICSPSQFCSGTLFFIKKSGIFFTTAQFVQHVLPSFSQMSCHCTETVFFFTSLNLIRRCKPPIAITWSLNQSAHRVHRYAEAVGT